MTESRLRTLSGCCSFLCSRPPSLERTRRWHAVADRFLAATRPVVLPVSILLGVPASFAEGWLDGRYRMLPATVVFFLIGSWCSLNFARCREAHCLITGAGFILAGVAAMVAVALDRDWSDPLWLAVLATLAGGVTFEAAWQARRGTNAFRRSRRPSPKLELGEGRGRLR